MAIDINKLYEMAEDTIKHKKFVLEYCHIMAIQLMKNARVELATQLLKRGCEHDNSKFDREEFIRMSQILKSRKFFTNASTTLSDKEKEAIKHHWSHNRHHPEYFENSDEMTELDILEMVCDWFARSLQYGTDFIPFVLERQENRFHFSEKQFEKILKYCRLMEQLSVDAVEYK